MKKTTKISTPQIDMSSEAIDRRLRTLNQLFKLGRSLQSARFVRKQHPKRDEQDQ